MYHLSTLVLQDRLVLNTRVQIFSECQHSHTLCTFSSKLEPTGILVSGMGFVTRGRLGNNPSSTAAITEETAKVYTDVTLLTSHQQILKDVSKIFEFFDNTTDDS